MQRELIFTDEADEKLFALENNPAKIDLRKQVLRLGDC